MRPPVKNEVPVDTEEDVYFLSVKQSELERKLALIVCVCTHAWCVWLVRMRLVCVYWGVLVCMRGYLRRWESKASHSRQSAARDVDHSWSA